MMMMSEGHFRCENVKDCDPRGCRGTSHVICKDHKCTCGHGAPIGGECFRLIDCNLSACPPNTHVLCKTNVCTCVPN
ncbi:unnamed protein product [Arabis nemorensis]|uniref:Uncharacterized protein n=1 Tax=Arabis nemorensis TaxID=586526 RepID=A0A565CHN5_9BRAS|nr:unnamed protein product [Arabis nemorensis]